MSRTLSPVIQHRLDAQKAKANATSTTSNAPVINFNIGKELVEIFHPTRPTSTVPAPAVEPLLPAFITKPAPALPVYDLHCPTLLHPSRSPGKDMRLTQFYVEYDLSLTILKKLHENFYKDARMICFIILEELKAMQFRFSEVAALRDAIDRWSVPNGI